MSNSELEFSLDDMAAATASFKADEGIQTASSPDDLSVSDINQALGADASPFEGDAELETENGFWGEGENPEESGTEEPVEGATIPDNLSQILRYKANGEEVELDLSTEDGRTKAVDALSRQEGMNKAFSDSAKAKKRANKLQAQIDELSKYRESWDKLEDLKHDRQRLLEFVTGEDYNEFMNRELGRKNAYETGSEEERRTMDYEDRMQAMEAEMRRDKDSRDRDVQKAQELRQEADYEKYNMWSQTELSKYVDQIPDSNPVRANKLKKALWRESIADVKSYYNKYGKITNKMVAKAFKDNADAMLGLYDTEVQTGVEKAIENKKVQAKEKAQVAASRNYDSGRLNTTDFGGMDPTKIFEKFRKMNKG